MSSFDTAREAMERGLESPEQTKVETQETQAPQDQAVSQAVHELEKLGKFKFEGEEYTPDDLRKAILRMKDYTTKTQEIGSERKKIEADRQQIEQDSNFYRNLSWDLAKVRENPSLAAEFVKIYPERFHKDLKEVLAETGEPEQSPKRQASKATPDVETLSRLERLEKYYTDQETAKYEQEIKSITTEMQAKYPDALKDLVMARAHDVAMGGVKLSKESWETLFKESDLQMKEMLKSRYGELVKKQTVANSKSRDVGSGGGTPGQAPQKFKNFSELNKTVIPQIIGDKS